MDESCWASPWSSVPDLEPLIRLLGNLSHCHTDYVLLALFTPLLVCITGLFMLMRKTFFQKSSSRSSVEEEHSSRPPPPPQKQEDVRLGRQIKSQADET